MQETFVHEPGPGDASEIVPVIYTRTTGAARATISERLLAGMVAGACLTVLFVGAWLTPNPHGVGTHMQLHLPACQFKEHTGLPCPSCGFTTAFTCFAHGKFLTSFYVQPMGALLALLAAVSIWVGFYIAATGRPIHRLFRLIPSRYYLMPLLSFALLAWGWKIVLTRTGHDGF